jgi:hypothetical protein
MKMKNAPDSQRGSGDAISIRAVLVFLTALGLSSLVLNFGGDRLVVRTIVGLAWGGYCLFAFGPDFVSFVRGRKKN